MATQHEIFSDSTQRLITLIEESTRASQITAKYFIEPAPGTQARAKSRRHHIVFGRRGSGKSSLLNKIHAENLVDRTPSAFVDLEKFKSHIYPDLLLSVLIQTFSEFKNWLDDAAVSPASKTTFWKAITSLKPTARRADRKLVTTLSVELGKEIEALQELLFQETVVNRETMTQGSLESGSSLSGEVQAGVRGAKVKSGASQSQKATKTLTRKDVYKTDKHQTLQRNILKYQKLFLKIKSISKSDVFLIFDDLYHIVKDDQAEVIDYFHKLAKGGVFWLKIGTVRHRTEHYRNGNPPIGVKLGDDIDSIDLDVTLEKYATTKKFLFEILTGFANEYEVNLSEILTDGARDRLVLVSGGVARDFLSLFRKSIEEARERVSSGNTTRGVRVTAEDVNRASGQYYDDKLQELDRDTADAERGIIEKEINLIRDFCFDVANANCLLVPKDRRSNNTEYIGELVDLKIIHPIRSGITVSKRQGERFDAFMLDYSFYTGDRTKRNFNVVDFWKPSSRDDILRKVGYIYEAE